MRNPPKSGLSDNLIAAIAYFGPVPAFFFLAVRRYNKRPYVRFHAWQSLAFDAFVFLFFSALEFVMPLVKFLGPRVLLGLWCVVCLVPFSSRSVVCSRGVEWQALQAPDHWGLGR